MRSATLFLVAAALLSLLFLSYPVSAKTDMAKYNARVGAKFLSENGEKAGVVTLKSGLQYSIIKSGGKKIHPKKSDTVKVHYRGTLINGKEFDSSYARGEPAQFGVSGVIAGWTEALQLMAPGDKWTLYIPSDLAYGPRGQGATIGPNSVLLFDVELLEIVGKSDL